MSRILVTGSSDGVGLLTARSLIAQGHRVTLHARSEQRASETMSKCPGAEHILVADLSSIPETKRLAAQANELGRFDAVIHNAGRGYRQPEQRTDDGFATMFTTNSLAPYILTCLMTRPRHLVYVSSALHSSGDASLEDLTWSTTRRWNGFQAYCDSKLHNVLLAFAVARYWPDVSSNALSPGWVPTKMGGSGAPDSLDKSYETQIWLITGEGKSQNGKYFFHKQESRSLAAASDKAKQDKFLGICEQVSGITFPK